jgi:ABC-type phosphate transport system substrate-binding protein
MKAGRITAALLAASTLLAARPSPAAEGFVVIVNPSVAGNQMHRKDLAAVFLKKVTRWGDRSIAEPVDQSGASPVRQAFSEVVLEMPVATVLQYWQKQMFASVPVRPPVVKPSDAEVIAFVARTAGAVGYVSSGASLPASVKAISLAD